MHLRSRKRKGRIDWTQPAINIERLVRAFTPWPGTFTYWDGQQLKIHSGESDTGSAEPGSVIEKGGRIAIGTGDGLFYPLRVQLAGKKAVAIYDFIRGRSDFTGVRLGE